MNGIVSGCSTTSQSTRTGTMLASTGGYTVSRQTATQKAIGKCVASVGVSAIIGGILGQAIGRQPGAGAAVGAMVGAGACIAFLELAAEEDQARLRQLEYEAIAADVPQTRQIQTRSGKVATIQTTVEEAPVPALRQTTQVAAVNFTTCRYATQAVEVGGQSATSEKQLWCRVEAGDWQPVEV